MANNKKSFLLYCDIIHTVKKLPNDKAGELFKFILSYVNDEDPELDDLLLEVAAEPIIQNLERDLAKWKKRSEVARINGAKGGAPKKAEKSQITQSVILEAEKAVSDTVTDTDNVKEKVTNTKKSIEDRLTAFGKSLTPYKTKYSEEMLLAFYSYWTEKGDNDKKMRFEKEKSFGVARRLGTWNKNEKKFNNGDGKNTKRDSRPADQERQNFSS